MGNWWSFGKSKKEANNPLISGNTRSSRSNVSNGSNGSNGNNKSFRNRKMNKETEKTEKTEFLNFFTGKKNNGSKEELDIFEKIQNIYFQRHAVSCANTIEKVYTKSGPLAPVKAQIEKSKYAANSGISYVGVQQCLQVCDYFSNFRINENQAKQENQQKQSKKPLIIFCCSELIRTQQTLFLSWLKYLKDYTEKDNGKIIVLPWLNEVSLPNPGGIVTNKDNYPDSLGKTIIKWNKFILNLKNKIDEIKKDTLNEKSSLLEDIKGIESWDNLFYLSPLIFKTDSDDPFSNSGKATSIKRIWEHKKRVGDMSQFIGLFNKILAEYIKLQNIELGNYNGIELVLVAHHNSAEHLMNFLLPSTHAQFEEQQLVNCEVVRLPGACLKNPGQNHGVMERIYPTKFNEHLSIPINREIPEEKEKRLNRRERRIFVNPLFILYMSELNLFLSVNNIVKTKLKARFVEGLGENKKNNESPERVQVKKPLFKFLFNLTAEDYLEELTNAIKYIEQLKGAYKGKQTFYNYAEMINKIQEKIGFLESYFNLKKNEKKSIENQMKNIQNQKSQKIQWYIKNNKKNKNKNITMKEEDISKELRNYLFGFCGLKQPDIDSIAVF